MAAYRRVYDSCYLQADCQEPDQLLNPTLGYRVWASFTFKDSKHIPCRASNVQRLATVVALYQQYHLSSTHTPLQATSLLDTSDTIHGTGLPSAEIHTGRITPAL